MRKKKRIPRSKKKYAEESRVVRLSPEVDSTVKALGHRNESYDNILRRLLGMPTTKHTKETSLTLYAIDDGTHLFTEEAVARGEAIKLAVKNKQKKPAPVMRIRTAI